MNTRHPVRKLRHAVDRLSALVPNGALCLSLLLVFLSGSAPGARAADAATETELADIQSTFGQAGRHASQGQKAEALKLIEDSRLEARLTTVAKAYPDEWPAYNLMLILADKYLSAGKLDRAEALLDFVKPFAEKNRGNQSRDYGLQMLPNNYDFARQALDTARKSMAGPPANVATPTAPAPAAPALAPATQSPTPAATPTGRALTNAEAEEIATKLDGLLTRVDAHYPAAKTDSGALQQAEALLKEAKQLADSLHASAKAGNPVFSGSAATYDTWVRIIAEARKRGGKSPYTREGPSPAMTNPDESAPEKLPTIVNHSLGKVQSLDRGLEEYFARDTDGEDTAFALSNLQGNRFLAMVAFDAPDKEAYRNSRLVTGGEEFFEEFVQSTQPKSFMGTIAKTGVSVDHPTIKAAIDRHQAIMTRVDAEIARLEALVK